MALNSAVLFERISMALRSAVFKYQPSKVLKAGIHFSESTDRPTCFVELVMAMSRRLETDGLCIAFKAVY